MKAKWVYFIVAAVAVSAVIYPVIYYQFNSSSVNSDPFSCTPLIPCQGTPKATTTCSTVCYIYMQDSDFTPQALNVTIGATIIWVNHDAFSHTTTSVNTSGWNSPPIGPSKTFTLNITSAFALGTYYYHCNIHPNMIALINVVK